MSSFTSAKLIVGLPRKDIPEDILDEGFLDSAFPYYDGGDDAIHGYNYIQSGDFDYKEITIDLNKIEELKEKFRKDVGLEPKLYLSPNVY